MTNVIPNPKKDTWVARIDFKMARDKFKTPTIMATWTTLMDLAFSSARINLRSLRDQSVRFRFKPGLQASSTGVFKKWTRRSRRRNSILATCLLSTMLKVGLELV